MLKGKKEEMNEIDCVKKMWKTRLFLNMKKLFFSSDEKNRHTKIYIETLSNAKRSGEIMQGGVQGKEEDTIKIPLRYIKRKTQYQP